MGIIKSLINDMDDQESRLLEKITEKLDMVEQKDWKIRERGTSYDDQYHEFQPSLVGLKRLMNNGRIILSTEIYLGDELMTVSMHYYTSNSERKYVLNVSNTSQDYGSFQGRRVASLFNRYCEEISYVRFKEMKERAKMHNRAQKNKGKENDAYQKKKLDELERKLEIK